MKPTAMISTNIADLLESLTSLAGENATQTLCNNLSSSATQGDLASVISLIGEYQSNPQKYNSETFDILVVNAFWRSCEHGHVECTQKLYPLMLHKKQQLGYGLEAACLRGHAEVVKFLIPILKLEECLEASKILMASIQGGSIDIVKMVLPHVKNRVTRTKGLREACKYSNQAIFDLLCPLSNPQSALDFMEKSNAPGIEMLRDEMARQQRVVLSEAVGEVSAKPVRKNKI